MIVLEYYNKKHNLVGKEIFACIVIYPNMVYEYEDKNYKMDRVVINSSGTFIVFYEVSK